MTTTIRPTRRLFFGAAGAAAAAPLAFVAPAAAVPGGDDLAARLARLEEQDALRALQAAYVAHVNAQARAELEALFAEAAQAHLGDDVRRLIEPEPAGVQIASDGVTALVRGRFLVEIETPIAGEDTIVAMARLQGDGVVRRTERRVLEIAAVKQDGAWKIARAELRAE